MRSGTVELGCVLLLLPVAAAWPACLVASCDMTDALWTLPFSALALLALYRLARRIARQGE